jgi:hypothetical protein
LILASEHTDLPKDETTDINVTELMLALLANEFLQAVDAGIFRGGNFEWRTIAFDETPKRTFYGVRHI